MENRTNGTSTLQARLSDPQTVAALTRLLDRIDTLEKTVNRLADMMEQAPGMVAMAGDMVDETVRQAAGRGVDIEERMKTAVHLAERLTAPETVANLDQLLTLADQAPGMAAMVGDMVDETVRQASASGIDIDARLRAGLAIAEKLTAPEMVAKLDQLLMLANQAPGMAAMVGDMVDETYRQAAVNGIDVEGRLRAGLEFAERLTAPEMTRALSTLLDPQVVAMLNKTGAALNSSLQAPPRQMSLFAMLGAMRQPDVQRALGFLVTFGEQLGKQINE